MKNVIGIDPGSGGGIAVRHPSGKVSAHNMPQTDGDLVNMFREIAFNSPSSNVVFLEDLVKHMGPGTPASTMAVYASNWGMIKGVVMAMGFRLQIIRPQVWQKYLNLGITGRLKAVMETVPDDYPPLAKQAIRDGNSAEKKRVQKLNEQLKRDWKTKLRAEAQRLYPEITMNLKKADAVLILEYGIRNTDV